MNHYERDPVKRQEFGFQIDGFVERLTDMQSKRMVQKLKNGWDVAIWPWDRQGFRSPCLCSRGAPAAGVNTL